MSSGLYCRFYFLRAYKDHPLELVFVLVTLTIFAMLLVFIFGVHERLDLLSREKRQLIALQPSPGPVTEINSRIVLPALLTSGLVKSFNEIAKDSAVPVNEVAYVLDNVETVPYVRYHITLTTKTGYSEIRKFVAIVSAEMPTVALDTISCSRIDTATTDLGCELVFSGFFSRAQHG